MISVVYGAAHILLKVGWYAIFNYTSQAQQNGNKEHFNFVLLQTFEASVLFGNVPVITNQKEFGEKAAQ